MRFRVDLIAPLAAVVLLAGCGGGGGGERGLAGVAPVPANGPQADFPMTIGEPFTIDGTTYVPADTMNYDAVGYVAIDPDGDQRISGSHKTLPIPSYVEVTSLDTGKTVLVRIERRGPMTNSRLIGLSPGALAQLEMAGPENAVRVRRVNPPEQERAMLRQGQRAAERMSTPQSLLAVLRRRLTPNATTMLSGQQRPNPAAAPEATASATPSPAATPSPRPTASPRPRPTATPTPAPTPSASPTPVAGGSLVVQVAAFSTRERADAAARALGGSVVPAGRLFRVRMGPFADQPAAQAALARARGAGYRDARIQRAD